MHIKGFKSVLESGLLLPPAARICWKFSGEKQATQNFVNDSLRSRFTAIFPIFARFAYCKVCFSIYVNCQYSPYIVIRIFHCIKWVTLQPSVPLAVQMLQTESKDGRSLFKESSLQGGLGILKGEDSLWWIHHHRVVQRVHPGRSSAPHMKKVRAGARAGLPGRTSHAVGLHENLLQVFPDRQCQGVLRSRL